MRPGVKTTEFWITTLLTLVGPIVTLLVGFGVFREEQATEVQANLTTAIEGVSVVISNLVSVVTAGRYVKARTELKKES